ncbi:kinase-like domain-containing protein [Rhizophagus irregularis DAOM 181602=DAOM 197198]|nr:kinase-like domain-containing protein [Rhizophagus irregularis DAOM 181602=DAOM 197198]
MNEIILHNKGGIDNDFIVRFYGITQDPETKNYMMVLDYAEAKEINSILYIWKYISTNEQSKILQAQINKINKYSLDSCITPINLGISNNTHSGAIYTSRLLDFNSLPEPKNSDDYYEQYDNIISKEFSDSLQIDISQLNNTHSGAIYTSRLLDFNSLPEPKNSDDYYEQYDNIISKEFSDSLQIDISQLNIN